MKKFILKGKELISKKLQQLDIASDPLDLVNEQIPAKLKQPFRVLQKTQIDLQSNELYQTYFRNYPNHHLSHYLLEKYENAIADNIQPPTYELPSFNKDAYVPNYDKELQHKALFLKQVIDEYDEGFSHMQEPVICVAVVHFHHKKGTQIEYKYPKNKLGDEIQNRIVHNAMPDSSHNKMEDYNCFNFQITYQNKRKMIFGVSYFKQVIVTEEMKHNNKEITRSHIQKAFTVITTLPVFGYLRLTLTGITKMFFQNLNDYSLIDATYKNLNKLLNEAWPNLELSELYIGSQLKYFIQLFGQSQFYQIWKAVLYQKRVVVFANTSSKASSFIISLLTLFPGLSTFGIFSKPISKYMQSLREYALPLRIFSSQNFMAMSFHIQDFHLLSHFKKSSHGHFLIGTTNQLLKQTNSYGIEMTVNLENGKVEKHKPRIAWQSLSKKQKLFISQIQQIVAIYKSTKSQRTQELIRIHFHNFLKHQLYDIIKINQMLKKFIICCQQYQKRQAKKSEYNGKKNENQYNLMQQEQLEEENNNKEKNDFPPIIPHQLLNLPFPGFILTSAIDYFLQFHNQNLPKMIENQIFPTLLIDNYQYFLKLGHNQFIIYNWMEKKISFGKGKLNNFQGKVIKFSNSPGQPNIVKQIFIGLIQNNKYQKNGFYLDTDQWYEGDFCNGYRQGYGKTTNLLHKYIGNFKSDLYEGQGQLITGKDIYVGEFKQGLRHGCGKNQGELNYDGEWVNNKPEGNGLLKIQGQQLIGVFEKGILNENLEVTIRYQNGSMYKGFIKNMLPEGRGYMVDDKGLFTSGIFVEGKFGALMESPLEIEAEMKANLRDKEEEEKEEKSKSSIKQLKRQQQP